MNILGVVLSEFHQKEGFRMASRDPQDNPLTEEQFKLYSDMILTRGSLCGRILAIEFLADYFLVVCPILSKVPEWDDKYKRAIYYYSVSIIVSRKDYLDKSQQPLYKQVVAKLAKFLQVIEETHHIIYDNFTIPAYADYLTSILQTFRNQINTTGQCNLSHLCSHYSFINAGRPAFKQEVSQLTLNSATVPVTLLTLEQIQGIESELGKQLLRYAYQGSYTFHRICRLHRQRKQAELRAFYMKGAEKGMIYLLDIINLNNCYVLTDKIKEYLPEQPLHEQLNDLAKSISKKEVVDPQELLCLYLQFNRVTPLHKLIQINRKLCQRIDVQQLVRCGQICGFLRRVHQKIVYSQFPQPLVMAQALKRVLQERGIEVGEQSLTEQSDKFSQLIKNDLKNGLTIDQIMVNLDVDYDKLLRLLNPQNRYIFKINNPV